MDIGIAIKTNNRFISRIPKILALQARSLSAGESLQVFKQKSPPSWGALILQPIDLKRVVALQHCQLYEVKQK
jgi:hypothetical protein